MDTHNFNARNMISAILLLAFSVVFLSWSYSYGERAQQVPVLVGWVMFTLCVLDVVASTGTRIGDMVRAFFSGTVIGKDNSSAAGKPVGRTIAAMLWPTAFVLMVGVFGFMAVIPVYVFLFVVLQGKKSFRQGIIAAAVTTAFTYVVFELLLSYEVYKGIVFSG